MDFREISVKRDSIVKYLFQACFCLAAVVSVAYLVAFSIAISSQQFETYNEWRLHFFLLSCIYLLSSLFIGVKSRVISSSIFYLSFIFVNTHGFTVSELAEYAKSLEPLSIAALTGFIAFVFPVVGILTSIAMLRHLQKLRNLRDNSEFR